MTKSHQTKSAQAETRPSSVTHAILAKTKLFLYVQAGGGCEFDGCYQSLFEHHMTSEFGIFVEAVHIGVCSDGGPPAGAPRRREKMRELDNLTPLRMSFHNRIDDDPESWIVDVVRAFNREHENRAAILEENQLDRLMRETVLQGHIAARVAHRHESRSNHHACRLTIADNTWAISKMSRQRKKAKRGERSVDKPSHGHGKSMTTIAALRFRDERRSIAADRATNADIFDSCLEWAIATITRTDNVIVTDNLSSHMIDISRKWIENAGAEPDILQPYIPDMNPIALVLWTTKQRLRILAYRTRHHLYRLMQRALNAVSHGDATNCFMHYGYTPRKRRMAI